MLYQERGVETLLGRSYTAQMPENEMKWMKLQAMKLGDVLISANDCIFPPASACMMAAQTLR